MRSITIIKNRGLALVLLFLSAVNFLGAQTSDKRELCTCEVYQAMADKEFKALRQVPAAEKKNLSRKKVFVFRRSRSHEVKRKRPRIGLIDKCSLFKYH